MCDADCTPGREPRSVAASFDSMYTLPVSAMAELKLFYVSVEWFHVFEYYSRLNTVCMLYMYIMLYISFVFYFALY